MALYERRILPLCYLHCAIIVNSYILTYYPDNPIKIYVAECHSGFMFLIVIHLSNFKLKTLTAQWCNFIFLTTCPQGKLDMKLVFLNKIHLPSDNGHWGDNMSPCSPTAMLYCLRSGFGQQRNKI
jgi:hypothetical protein